ncbi:hypothetical protein DH2020_013331 [Rehmannia glutinosa]|uniref:Coatomer WD associated region domain-containing protein n=1 Tax=Rehmannia glutinosa TaxID=99300 RepID=A0ABR0X1Y4_REHGL
MNRHIITFENLDRVGPASPEFLRKESTSRGQYPPVHIHRHLVRRRFPIPTSALARHRQPNATHPPLVTNLKWGLRQNNRNPFVGFLVGFGSGFGLACLLDGHHLEEGWALIWAGLGSILASLYSGTVCIWNYQTQIILGVWLFIPLFPYVLSSSDDMLIKLWDWEKGWLCTQIFEGHSHYVMQVTLNPKDTNTIASASLDRTIKIWNLGSPDPNFTLDAHLKGVNCVDYFTGGDKPYLITGSDDHTAKVWDYQTKSCVQTLEGHTHNVSAVCFHPELPIIITGSEDGTVRIWHSTTYRVVIGYDEGTIMVKLGREVPVASMDNSGKIIWAKHNEIQTVNIKSIGADYEVADGERLPLAVKELGNCDLYPQSLKHNPNGRFVVVCGDGEYIIYTALAWRNRSFGSALEFVWSTEGEYAVRESTSKIKIFSKNFLEKKSIRPTFSAEHIYGGTLLAMCSNDFICFYDWAECRLIRRIDVNVKRDVVSAHLDSGRPVDEQGVEDAFELLYEINERVRTGLWVGDCFIYNNSSWRLNYCVGGEVTTMFHLDRPMYLLGYLANQSRVYLVDKEFNVIGYTLLLSLIEYKTLVMRGDLERANEVLPSIPKEQLNSVARFLESRGMIEDALEVATDPDYRFELAIQLGKLEIAKEIATVAQSESKWKQLGELAMSTGMLEMAEECLKQANDLSGLLLLYSSLGNAEGITELASLAKEHGKNNVAFLCLFMLGKLEDCLQLLVDSNRIPEAALMARSYLPSKVSEIVALWRKDLNKINQKAAESLADPEEYPNLFEEWQIALAVEAKAAETRDKYPPAVEYVQHADRSTASLFLMPGYFRGLPGRGDQGTECLFASGVISTMNFRAAGVQLSRDNPGLDDNEETSEQEGGTFKRASDEVLASRRIVKIRRQQTSTPSAPLASNPFAAISLVPPTSAPVVEIGQIDKNYGKSDNEADDPKGESNVKPIKIKDVESQVKLNSEKDESDVVVAEKVAEGEKSANGAKKATEDDNTKNEADKDVEGKRNNEEKGNGEITTEKNADTFGSFRQLSSSQNAFCGFAGTGFSSTSFSFGSSIHKDGSPLGSTTSSLFALKNDQPSVGFGISSNGNSSIFELQGQILSIKVRAINFLPCGGSC